MFCIFHTDGTELWILIEAMFKKLTAFKISVYYETYYREVQIRKLRKCNMQQIFSSAKCSTLKN